jgi:threonine dehydratase
VITVADIETARDRIAPHVRRTPVMHMTGAKDALPTTAQVTLKLECLQVTGSFKARGAMNRYLSAPREEIANGIVTASGGNHGLAVARTAYAAGTKATIFLPSNVSPAKLAKMQQWGAETRIVGNAFDEANAAALENVRQTGAAYFHPFADPAVVAGQGTLGLEILDDMSDIDTILVAIGGGGLISGLSTAIRARRPDIRIIGIEPIGSPTLKACLDAGKLVALPHVTTKVPTMACRQTDQKIFETVSANIERFILVSDEQMEHASRWLWFEAGVAADLSGAASIAAIQSRHPLIAEAKHLCALVCGAGPDGTY